MSERRTLSRGARRTDRGFTMVELLVAMVLGLFLLGGVISIFTTSRQTFRVNENMARVQENARFSFEVLMREIREAGTVPCGARKMANVVDTTPAWWADWGAGTVVGFNEDQDTAPKTFGTGTGDRLAGTDAITVLRPISDESTIQTITNHNVGSNRYSVPTPSVYGDGDVVMLCDADTAVLMEVSSVTGTEVKYNSGNCSVNLGYPTPPLCAAPPAKTFPPGAMVAKFDPAFWYIGKNAAGGSSLYRMQIVRSGGTPTVTTQEMVTNVSNMQIEYLTRNSGSVTPLATTWVNAKTIADQAGGWTTANAEQVVAVRLTLTFLTDEKVGSDGNAVQRKYVAVSSLRARDIP